MELIRRGLAESHQSSIAVRYWIARDATASQRERLSLTWERRFLKQVPCSWMMHRSVRLERNATASGLVPLVVSYSDYEMQSS